MNIFLLLFCFGLILELDCWCYDLDVLFDNLSSSLFLVLVLAALARKVSLLKRHCFASVFEYMFDKQATGGCSEKAIVHYRDEETM